MAPATEEKEEVRMIDVIIGWFRFLWEHGDPGAP